MSLMIGYGLLRMEETKEIQAAHQLRNVADNRSEVFDF